MIDAYSPIAQGGRHRVAGAAGAPAGMERDPHSAAAPSSWAKLHPQWVAIVREKCGLLADDFLLLAHDERGVPLVAEGVVRLGIAAALLAELVLDGQITIERDTVVLCEAEPPDEPLARYMVSTLTREGEDHTVRDLLAFFALTATQQVAKRLPKQNGVDYRRRVPFLPGRWVPRDPNAGMTVGITLANKLVRPRKDLSAQRVVLAGLARVTGLESVHRALAELSDNPRASNRLDDELRRLSPALRALLRDLEQVAAAYPTLGHR